MRAPMLQPHVKLDASMGEIILAHLGQQVDFTKLYSALLGPGCFDVVIAGQAVASAVSELFADASAVVYNDVDAFVHLKPDSQPVLQQRDKRRSSVLYTSYYRSVKMLTNEYGHVSYATEGAYKVLSTAREGLLNEVYCDYAPARSAFDLAETIRFLRTFDLNCVQVGVRLSDKALVWTPAFEKFLATRELLVEGVATPLHTAMRWFKKKAELPGIYGRDDWAMELLGAAAWKREVLLQSEEREHGVHPLKVFGNQGVSGFVAASMRALASPLLFAQKTKDLFDRFEDSLQEYFSLERVSGAKIDLFTLTRKHDVELDQEVVRNLEPQLLPMYVRAHQGYWRKSVSAKVLQAFEPLRRGAWHCHIREVYPIEVLHSHGVQVLADPKTSKDLARIGKMLGAHRVLTRLARMETFDRVLAVCNALEGLSKTRGLQTFGLLDYRESALWTAVRDLPIPAIETGVQALVDRLEKEIEDLKDSARYLFRKGLGQVRLAGYEVCDLRDPIQLYTEGARMHHCVGGYALGVLAGHCAIFSLRKKRVQDSLTLELAPAHVHSSDLARNRLVWANSIRPRQLRGVANRSPDPREIAVCERLVQAVNLREAFGRLDVLPFQAYWWLAGVVPASAGKPLSLRVSPGVVLRRAYWQGLRKRLFGRLFQASWWRDGQVCDVSDMDLTLDEMIPF